MDLAGCTDSRDMDEPVLTSLTEQRPHVNKGYFFSHLSGV